MTREENKVFDLYLTIKQDIVNNLSEVFKKQHTYTHKYRGGINRDINVALDYGPSNERIIQIFVRENGKWIRDRLSIFEGRLYDSEIKSNILYNE